MPREGWLPREATRQIKDSQAWLPFIRGQQDVVLRLIKLPDNRTRILAGEAEKDSWQLKPPTKLDTNLAQAGIEAADFTIPLAATNVKYDSDQKQIEFQLPNTTPLELADQFTEQLSTLKCKASQPNLEQLWNLNG